MIVTADATDAAGDKVGISRIFAFHEDAVTPEDGRGAMALYDLPLLEVNLGINTQTSNDSCDRIPRHLYKLWWRSWGFFSSHFCSHDAISFGRAALHRCCLVMVTTLVCSLSSTPFPCAARMVPCWWCCWSAYAGHE